MTTCGSVPLARDGPGAGAGAPAFGLRRPTKRSRARSPIAAPDSVIATGAGQGATIPSCVDGEAAIAYDPDGCQVWIIDDGIEGYSTPRFDPRPGLPVCDGKLSAGHGARRL